MPYAGFPICGFGPRDMHTEIKRRIRSAGAFPDRSGITDCLSLIRAVQRFLCHRASSAKKTPSRSSQKRNREERCHYRADWPPQEIKENG